MMNPFVMEVDQRSTAYLMSIVKTMIQLFSISEEEAYGRINNYWFGQNMLGDQLMLYHEDEEYWSKTIYYGKNSFWWLREGENIAPIPYP